MKLWVDDIRPAPKGYRWITNTREAKIVLTQLYRYSTNNFPGVEVLDLDHDAGNSGYEDFIDILTWLEEKQNVKGWRINFPIHIHSMNPVGRGNMRAIIRKNGWKEILF